MSHPSVILKSKLYQIHNNFLSTLIRLKISGRRTIVIKMRVKMYVTIIRYENTQLCKIRFHTRLKKLIRFNTVSVVIVIVTDGYVGVVFIINIIRVSQQKCKLYFFAIFYSDAKERIIRFFVFKSTVLRVTNIQ